MKKIRLTWTTSVDADVDPSHWGLDEGATEEDVLAVARRDLVNEDGTLSGEGYEAIIGGSDTNTLDVDTATVEIVEVEG